MSTALAWDPQKIGTVMFTSALVGLLLQAPAGALVDRVHSKPRWIAGALIVIAACLLAMAAVPSYYVILAGQSMIGICGALVAPAIAATSLGIVGRQALDARIGRNTAITAAGTVLWALGTGIVGRVFGPRAMFIFAVALATPTIIAALAIKDRDIDLKLARGADASDPTTHIRHWYGRPLIVLLACAFLFHLANASLLTIVAQEIGAEVGEKASLWLSAGVIVTQLMTIPIGLAVGRWAPRMPRKPIFLIAFAVLPVRALLYLQFSTPLPLIAMQILDGIGAGIFGVMLTLMIGDITRGTGRFNLALGISAVAGGLGAAFSNLVAGSVAKAAGYATTFIVMAVIAGIAVTLFALAMPETRHRTAETTKPAQGAGLL
jgi:MFS family permease